MIKSGYKPRKFLWFPIKDHRDFSHKSFGSVQVPFPPSYNTDDGLDMPNQDADGLPFGCTDETQSEVANDLMQKTVTLPWTIEEITHANALGGIDVRTSLKAAVGLGWFTGYFNIEALGGQDMFDAVRDAQVSGGTEKRSVSVGTKWFPEFEQVGVTGLMPMPNFAGTNFSWHNWKICGWQTIGDQVYLVGKSWQGPGYGDKGLVYFSRPLFNQLMAIGGSAAFTVTKGVLPPIQTISTTWLQWLISYAKNLLPY